MDTRTGSIDQSNFVADERGNGISIIQPVGCQSQTTARAKHALDRSQERRFDQAAFLLAAFRPGIREEHVYLVQRMIGEAVEQFFGIHSGEPYIGQILSREPLQQVTKARPIHFTAEKIPRGMTLRQRRQRGTVPAADLESARPIAAEQRRQIVKLGEIRHGIPWPQGLECQALCCGDTAVAPDKTANMPAAGVPISQAERPNLQRRYGIRARICARE